MSGHHFRAKECDGILCSKENCEARRHPSPYVTKRQDTVDKLVSGKKSRPIIGKAGGGQPECCNLPVGHMSRCAEIPLVVRIASSAKQRSTGAAVATVALGWGVAALCVITRAIRAIDAAGSAEQRSTGAARLCQSVGRMPYSSRVGTGCG